MSLESMNKADLVKYARKLEQDEKALRSEIEDNRVRISELSDQIEDLEKPKDTTNTVQLPYTAVALIPDSKTNHMRFVKLKFDFEGNSEVKINKKYESHTALMKAEDLLAEMDKKLNKNKE